MDQVAVLGAERSTIDVVASAFESQEVETIKVEHRADAETTIPDAPYLLAILCLAEIDGADPGFPPLLAAVPADTPVVFAAPPPSLEMALHAVRVGAFDLFMLPPRLEAVRDLLIRARLYRQNMALRKLATFSRLSGWFAHEVRNPLSGILTSAQLSIERLAASDPVRRYLKIIVEETGHLEQFLKRVTELGRSVRGPRVPADLNAAVERALAQVGPRLRGQRIRMKRRLDPRLPEVRIDVARMELAISRIIAGAVEEMTSAGGLMTVLTRYRPRERMIELKVTDTNRATAHERQRRFCDPFACSRLKEAELGLACALQTFAEHGGDMSFHADSGRGGGILARLPLNGQREL